MIEKVKKLEHKDPVSEITSNVQTMKMQMDKDQTETGIKENLGKRIRSKKKIYGGRQTAISQYRSKQNKH